MRSCAPREAGDEIPARARSGVSDSWFSDGPGRAGPLANTRSEAGQGPVGRQGGGRAGGAADGKLIGGTLTPAKPDARGWGWQVKASINPATPRPFYNKAKELLFQDKQITSYTISTYNPEFYCEVAKHYDYIWFEMQHSTMSYRRGAPDDSRLPRCRRGADDPHARRARIEDPEGDRPRCDRRHRADRGRCARGAGRGAVLALSAVRPAQLGRRVVRSGVARGQLPRDGQRQHARHRHDRNARRCGQRRGDRRDARRGRRARSATTISRASPVGRRTIRGIRTR